MFNKEYTGFTPFVTNYFQEIFTEMMCPHIKLIKTPQQHGIMDCIL